MAVLLSSEAFERLRGLDNLVGQQSPQVGLLKDPLQKAFHKLKLNFMGEKMS